MGILSKYRSSLWLKEFNVLWRNFKRNRPAAIGLTIVLFFVFMGVLAPYVSPYDPTKLGVGKRLESPSQLHLFGTDDMGRDVFSRVLYGARVSLMVGMLAATAATLIGIAIGALSGYVGGIVDSLLMRITELFMIIPTFFLAIIMVMVFGATIWNIILVITIITWPGTARLVRGQFLSVRELSFVEAAKISGFSGFNIIFDEILPSAISPAIINGSLRVGTAITMEASLSFLGAGDPTLPSWGKILSESTMYLRDAWWIAIFAGLPLVIVVLALNLVGDGMNEAMNPKLRQR